MISPRECFPLGRGAVSLRPVQDQPTGLRPFGMRCAIAVAAVVEDDLSGLAYDPVEQVVTLAEPTGDPAADQLAIAAKTTTTRATDRDGSKPSTPKDFNTDSD